MIAKVTLQFTVLLEAVNRAEAEREITNMAHNAIIDECDNGLFIGSGLSIVAVDDVTTNAREELLAIGNDGEFFEAIAI
jgi:hypothetical protein